MSDRDNKSVRTPSNLRQSSIATSPVYFMSSIRPNNHHSTSASTLPQLRFTPHAQSSSAQRAWFPPHHTCTCTLRWRNQQLDVRVSIAATPKLSKIRRKSDSSLQISPKLSRCVSRCTMAMSPYAACSVAQVRSSAHFPHSVGTRRWGQSLPTLLERARPTNVNHVHFTFFTLALLTLDLSVSYARFICTMFLYSFCLHHFLTKRWNSWCA